jgi:hypothetical protein
MDEQIKHHDHPKPRSTLHLKPTSSHSHVEANGCVVCESALSTLDLTTSLNLSPTTTAPLKDDHGNHDNAIIARLKSVDTNCGEQAFIPLHPINKMGDEKNIVNNNVSFHPTVQVREIPSHHSYSERIKKTIWMLPHEYAESVTKNVIEFMSEGYAPETVLDESDFVERDGELVHPVCLMLEEPENVRLRQIYYGFNPNRSVKEYRSPRKISKAL